MKILLLLFYLIPIFLFSQTKEAYITDTMRIKVSKSIEGKDSLCYLKNIPEINGRWFVDGHKTKHQKAIETNWVEYITPKLTSVLFHVLLIKIITSIALLIFVTKKFKQ